MANQAQFVLQVSDFTLAGIDKTNRIIRVKGNAIPIIVPASLNTATVVAGGTGYAVGDLLTIAGMPGAIVKVATLSTTAVATVTIVKRGGGGTATTGAATTAMAPSLGSGATITTVVNAGSGGLLIITGFSITGGVITFNVVNALTGGGGQTVIVQGFNGPYAYLNGSYTTATATATTVTATLAVAAVGQTSIYATMTVQPTYVTGGVDLSYQFVDQLGLPRPIGGIGPTANANWIKLQSKIASTLSYETNITQTGITPLVRAFSWASTAGEVAAGALTADYIGFLAEFTFGAF